MTQEEQHAELTSLLRKRGIYIPLKFFDHQQKTNPPGWLLVWPDGPMDRMGYDYDTAKEFIETATCLDPLVRDNPINKELGRQRGQIT